MALAAEWLPLKGLESQRIEGGITMDVKGMREILFRGEKKYDGSISI